MRPDEWLRAGFAVRKDHARRRSGLDMLRLSGVTLDLLADTVVPAARAFPPHIRARVAVDAVYEPYVARARAEEDRLARDARLRLPSDLDYQAVTGLSTAERAALQAARPESLDQAKRVEGVTPAGCVHLLKHVHRTRLSSSSSSDVERSTLEEKARAAGHDLEADDMEDMDARARASEL